MSWSKSASLLALLCLISTTAIALVNADGIEDALKDAVEQNFGKVDLNSITDEAGNQLKKKCLKEGTEEDYKKADEGARTLKTCLEGLIDFETVTKEIEAAKPNGDLDTVFKKYCGKSPELKKCVSDFTKTTEGCLNSKERESVNIILNITESLTDFVCFKEGDRIALFIAEGGPECLEEKSEDIQECFNATVSKHVPKDKNITDITPDDIPELVFDEKLCDDIQSVQNCIVDKLVSCKEPTPSNIAESLFKFIRQVTPCDSLSKDKKRSKQSSTNSAPALPIPGLLLTITLLGTVYRIY